MVWNLSTRILHWCVAIPVLLNFFLDGEDDPHKVLGYVAATTVLLRIIWGFITKDEAHFSKFPLNFKPNPGHLGHNPMASWAYILIWIMVISLGVSGYLMGTDQFWGEEWLEELHESFSIALKVLVGAHFAGLIIDGVRFKRPTWRGMIDGKKERP